MLKIRNVFGPSAIEEPLEIPCNIIGAQLSLLGSGAMTSSANSETDSDKIKALLAGVFTFDKLLSDTESLTKE